LYNISEIHISKTKIFPYVITLIASLPRTAAKPKV